MLPEKAKVELSVAAKPCRGQWNGRAAALGMTFWGTTQQGDTATPDDGEARSPRSAHRASSSSAEPPLLLVSAKADCVPL
jgi:hypothetical protein